MLDHASIQALRHVVNSYAMCWQSVSMGMSPTEAGTKEASPNKARKAEKGYLEQEFVDDVKRGGFIFITEGSSGKNRIFHL